MTQNARLQIKNLIKTAVLRKIKEITELNESKLFFENIFSKKDILEYWTSLKTNLKSDSSYALIEKIREIDWIRSNTTLGSPILDGDSTIDLYIYK